MRAPEFWRRDARGLWPVLLHPLSWPWQAAGLLRRRLTTPVRLPVPVICIGNLVAGGAGKTPTALALASWFAARGVAVHILSRGYGGTTKGPLRVDPARHDAATVGDEALLLARVAPTWVAARRPAAARQAVQAGAELLLLDDGHQNPTLAKDLSFVVIDAGFGLGNGRVMPAGPLRESAAAGLARADAVVLIDAADMTSSDPARALAGHPAPHLPLLRARLEPGIAALALRGRSVVAFAGIGRPAKFFATLEQLGCRLHATYSFADHHVYSPDEIMRLVETAQAAEATLVTTEKDQVRLPAEARPMVETLPVMLRFADETALARLLTPLLHRVEQARDGR